MPHKSILYNFSESEEQSRFIKTVAKFMEAKFDKALMYNSQHLEEAKAILKVKSKSRDEEEAILAQGYLFILTRLTDL